MAGLLEYLFGSASFVPHGYCLMWRPDLVAMHAISDALIAIAYFSIPGAIFLFIKQRVDFEFRWTAVLFVSFIALCGLTHIAALVTLWQPYYGLQGMVKAATATVSVLTAVSLWPLLPKLLAVPSPFQLRQVNHRLEDEIARHKRTEQELILTRDMLEERVRERTRELEDALSAQKNAERQLANRAAELERSNRELDDFAHVASHDLKEPIRGIANTANFFVADHGDTLKAEALQQIENIIQLAKRMDMFLNDLLTYSRFGHTKMGFKPTDIRALVEDALVELRPMIEEHGAEVVVEDTLPTVYCDKTRVREVFRNLVTNALKYNDSDKKRIEIGAVAPAKDKQPTSFFVKDNGIGVASEFEGRIFGMFKRLHGRDEYGGGSGAGLAIVKRIIEQHNGDIWYENVPDGGTVFLFTLGMEREAAEAHV